MAEEEFEIIMPEDGDGDETLIEVVDDTPLEDRGRRVAPEHSEDDREDHETEAEYSDRVKKRIAKETEKTHAERRAKEQAARERDEAIRIAQDAIARANALQAQTSQYEQGFVYSAKSKAEVEIEQAEAEYQRAFENGDSKAMAAAMQKATRAQIDKSHFDNYVPPPAPQPQQQQVVQPQQQVQVPPQISAEELARQTKFINENSWFNKDQEMTQRALQIDAHVRQNAPHIVGTDEYYDFVSTMMRQSFPEDRFAKRQPTQQAKPPGQGVAPVTRASGKTPRKITLTESQVRLAKRLGITPQQYAAELIKQENS